MSWSWSCGFTKSEVILYKQAKQQTEVYLLYCVFLIVMAKHQMQWKPLQIDDSNLNAQGLIALEECTDYDLTQVLNNVKVRKRQNSKTDKVHAKKAKSSSCPDTKIETISLTPSKCGSSIEIDVEMQDKVNDEDYKTWSSFGLPEPIIKALSEQGFEQPTPIQLLTLPAAVLGRRDIVGAAETGSGKTLAFGLPILAGILKAKDINDSQRDKKPLYALILTPTRELAMQVRNHLMAAAKFVDINVAVVIGGMAAVKQERILGKGPEIVVATPGRLWELIQEGNAHLSQIDEIRYLAIDETDRMLERGHFEELHSLLERLNFDKTKSDKRQNFVFSATLTLVHDLPKYLMKKSKISKMTSQQKLKKIVDILGITNPKMVDITQEAAVPGTLTESRISCAFEEKDYYVYYFLQKHPGRTLIFCNSIGCVKRLANLLSILDCRPLPLHASMPQRQRLKNLERFTDEEDAILVATDVAARGLDIPKIQHVLHYQAPRTSETYIHRSGRTARASQDGLALLLIEPSEIHSYIKLCRTLDRREDFLIFPIQENYLRAVKERVNLARELDKLDLGIRKTSSEESWLQKAAKEMDIIVDDFSRRHDNSELTSHKKIADVKRKQLSFLLNKPIFPRGFSGKYPFNLGGDFLNDETSAVELLKTTVKNESKQRKNIPLFKSNKNKKGKKSK